MNARVDAPLARRTSETPEHATADAAPRSCLYECRVEHRRFAPREHRFAYRLFYLCVDLDELPLLRRRLRLLAVNGAGLLSFRERDFLPLGEPLHQPIDGPVAARLARDPNAGAAASLKERAAAFCAAHGVPLGAEPRVELVTLPRLLGHQFNPVSFYFCADRTGAPRAAIAEVTNTFREVKPYLIPLAPGSTAFRLRVPKHFYVSPFSSVDVEFDFHFRAPGARLALRIDDYAGGQRVFHSTLAGERVPLTDARLAWLLAKYPCANLGLVARIHWQALRLWSRRVPFFRKADAAERQRGLYRPDISIADRPAS